MSWRHTVCDSCYNERSAADDAMPETPVRLKHTELEKCCGCGVEHTSGIYIRAEPSSMQCRGNHEQED